MHKAVALDREWLQPGRVLGLGRIAGSNPVFPDSVLKKNLMIVIRLFCKIDFLISLQEKELALFQHLFRSSTPVVPNFDIFLRKGTFVLVCQSTETLTFSFKIKSMSSE